jgi:glutamate carboxypeptidase
MAKSFVHRTIKKSLPWFTNAGALTTVNTDYAEELEKLKQLVLLSSPSNDREGVEKMQNIMRTELEELGFTCEFLPHPEDKVAPFLKAEVAGETKEFVTLICHTDTVLNSEGFKLSDDGKIAYGSGIIDNKGGLVVMLSGLEKLLKECPRLKYSLRVLCSPNEEVGSAGYIPVYLSHAKDTKFGLGMEPALANGSIVCQRRGNRWYDIEVTGREAHAGRSRGEHANAAHDLAKKIVALQALNNLKKERAVNIGWLQGGQDRYNIICGKANAKLDVRFSTLEDRDWLQKKIDAILKKNHEFSACGKYVTHTTYKIVDDCPPVAPTRKAMKLSQIFISSIASLEGRQIKAEAAGGAGDVNYLSRAGVVVLDGLGPVGGEMHTRREYCEVRTLGTRAVALAHFLKSIQEY